MSDDSQPSVSFGVERQFQIYMGGLTGTKCAVPISPDLLEQRAREVLAPEAYDGVAGGAGSEETLRANRDAFRRWRIVPRMLRDVGNRDLGVNILGTEMPAPVMVAPVGAQSVYHADAETATAKAAASLGIPMILSTVSSTPMEEVAEVLAGSPAWYQLYWGKDFDLAASMLSRAEKSGYRAIVVTVDTAVHGWRDRDLDYAFSPFLLGQGQANYFSDPVFRAALSLPPEEDPVGAVRYWSSILSNASLTWNDLAFLRKHTRLPILLKGIQHPDDAAEAVARGVDGIIVSNHGGRQLDGGIGALDALPAVVREVNGAVPVLFDSGIRRGSDAVKALALGAKAVLLGRPVIYGLAIAGEVGVREVLSNFMADLDLAFALTGVSCCKDLDVLALVKEDTLASD